MPQTKVAPERAQTNQTPIISTSQEFQRSVQAEVERRSIIAQFVTSQLKEDIDYGHIKINGRSTKPTLFKPGMEKIFSLFNIVSKLEKDESTLSMIDVKDVIAYKCELYRNNVFISEGRGACAISEKSRVNDVIKIAEKRARMDACLNLGFSEYFTQDLDDIADVPVASSPQTKNSPTQYQDLSFTVESKEELTAQNGNRYARMKTDQGTVLAFRDNVEKFEEGSAYRTSGIWEEKNGSKAFIVTGYTVFPLAA